jgi:hypothetical protein
MEKTISAWWLVAREGSGFAPMVPRLSRATDAKEGATHAYMAGIS